MSRDARLYLSDMLTGCERVLRYTANLSQAGGIHYACAGSRR